MELMAEKLSGRLLLLIERGELLHVLGLALTFRDLGELLGKCLLLGRRDRLRE